MWFKFPPNVSRVSVEQQEFSSEFEQNGASFFRAPDHFAALIMSLPGFEAQVPENCDLPDLPQPDPLRDGSIKSQAIEITRLKAALEAEQSNVRALTAARKDLEERLQRVMDKNRELEDALEEAREALPTPVVGVKMQGKPR